MSTPADYLTYIYGGVDDAWDACAEKGATVPTSKDVAELGDTIRSIEGGGGGGGWVWPSDWGPELLMPDVPGMNCVCKLWPNQDTISVFVQTQSTASDAARLNWGDGTSESLPRGVCTHQYNWPTIPSPVLSDGSKIVQIEIRAINNIISYIQWYRRIPRQGALVASKLNGQGFTSFQSMFGSANVNATNGPENQFEYFNVINMPTGIPSVTMFQNCSQLKRVITDGPFVGASATIFNGCGRLEDVIAIDVSYHNTNTFVIGNFVRVSANANFERFNLIGTFGSVLTTFTLNGSGIRVLDMEKLYAVLPSRVGLAAGTININGTEASQNMTPTQLAQFTEKNWTVSL